MKIRLMLAAVGLALAAGVSNAQIVVFTDTGDGPATGGSYIKTWDFTNGVLTRATYAPGVRLAGIDHAPGGTCDFYVADGVKPPPSGALAGTGRLLKVTDVLGAASTSVIATGQQIWNPIGIRFDSRSNSVIDVDNLTSPGNPPEVVRGLYGINVGSGVQTLLQQERVSIPGVPPPNPEGRAFHEGGTYISNDSRGVAGRYYVMSATGGRHVGAYQGIPNLNVSSAIWKVDVDATATSSTFTEFVDTSSAGFVHNSVSIPGALTNYTDFRGICMDADNNIYITSTYFGLIIKMTTDANGDFTGSSVIASGLNAPETIEYDEFTNTLVFAQIGARTLSRINLDGTGLTTLATNVHVRGIDFCPIPTPGAIAGIGMVGLVALRRRR